MPNTQAEHTYAKMERALRTVFGPEWERVLAHRRPLVVLDALDLAHDLSADYLAAAEELHRRLNGNLLPYAAGLWSVRPPRWQARAYPIAQAQEER